jgi:hypothetical protein
MADKQPIDEARDNPKRDETVSNENAGKGVFVKMHEYLMLALLYGGLAGSYLVLALRIKG